MPTAIDLWDGNTFIICKIGCRLYLLTDLCHWNCSGYCNVHNMKTYCPTLLLLGILMLVRYVDAIDPSPPNKTIPGIHLGSPPPTHPELFSYTTYLSQNIAASSTNTTKLHSFLAGNNVYYISSGRWGNPGNDDDETIGLTHAFFNDLRSRGTGIVEYGTTGIGNDFWGESSMMLF